MRKMVDSMSEAGRDNLYKDMMRIKAIVEAGGQNQSMDIEDYPGFKEFKIACIKAGKDVSLESELNPRAGMWAKPVEIHVSSAHLDVRVSF
jgi:hypothetical protein